MADLAASDVTITVQETRIEGARKRNRVKIAFGDGALTYPANGVPLPAFGSFGMKRYLEYITITDANDASGIMWKFDQENKKLRAWLAPAQTHGHDLLIIGGQAATTTNEVAHYGAAILGKEEAANATIAKADVATKGGVVGETLASAAGTELGNVAVAAQVLYVEAVGW
jgi:hypothetical protein